MKTIKQFTPYLLLLGLAFSLSLGIKTFPFISNIFYSLSIGFYLSLALLFAIGYGINYFAPKTSIPVFVWAILFGMALQLPLVSLTTNRETLMIVINLLAALILFASGIQVPTKNFKKYFAPIATLSVLGTLLSVFIFALALSILTTLFGLKVSTISLLILSAILASMDPSTIIPTLDKLHFRKPFLKDIAISESAVNDVVGIILTRFFLISILGASTVATFSLSDGVTSFFSQKTFESISLEIVWGIMVGFLGAWILKTWGESIGKKHWSDPALFFSVPILCFSLGSIVGSSGFLASFIAGLIFDSEGKAKEVHMFFESLVDRFIKPIVFIILGAFTPMYILVATMPLGTMSAIIFMFAIRPLVVYLSLLPWMISKNTKLEWRELLFLSFIRETGAIPAVLLLYTVSVGIIGGSFVYSIAVWVILYTLIIEPPLTPLIGKYLEVTD